MTDLQKGGRVVPIIAPRQHSHSDGSPQLINDSGLERLAPEQGPREHPSRASRNARGKLGTECLELPSLTRLGLYALPTEGDGTVSPNTALVDIDNILTVGT